LPTGRDGWPLLLLRRRRQGLLQQRGWRLQVGLQPWLGLCLLLILCVLLRLRTGESLLRSLLSSLQVLIIEHNTLAAWAVGVVL
jgi:hypothetical protein